MSEPTDNTSRTRRWWLKWAVRTALFGSVGGVLIDTFWIEPHWLDVVRRDLPIAHLPERWHGRLFAQVSDVHVGHQVSDDFLIRSFQRLAEYAPDVVVVTGDFVTYRPEHPVGAEQLHEVYRHLPHGKWATLGIFGNHDYGAGWSDLAEAERLRHLLADHGLTILRNETADVEGLQVVGLDDLWAHRCDAKLALATSSAGAARLVLCHNPDAADKLDWAGYQGWILAGHTHGGQCKPPFLPPPVLPVANSRYAAGEVDLFDGRRLYVNRGLGHLIPVRFNVRPEITLFRLVAAG